MWLSTVYDTIIFLLLKSHLTLSVDLLIILPSASGFPSVWWMILLSRCDEQQSGEGLWVSRGIETSFFKQCLCCKGKESMFSSPGQV